ncbi:MAG: hypothetical protein VW338_17220 [Rhodospirillaceae bacterium]
MEKFKPVKALAFDYYGTIADKTALAGEIETKLPGRGLAFTKLWFAQTQRYCFQMGQMGRHIPWGELTKAAFKFSAEEMGLEIDDATRDAWMDADAHLPVYGEAAAALERLATRFNLSCSPWARPA